MADATFDDLDKLAHRLLARMQEIGPAVVALSGGVDSAVVAKAAFLAWPGQSIAATAISPSVARRERNDSEIIAKQIGIQHRLIPTNEFSDPNYVKNDGRRCYFCKSTLYRTVAETLPSMVRNGMPICSGAHKDDLGDYRPGLDAAREFGVIHPLIDVGFGKREVRLLAQHWGLSNWDKPAAPCLSSRVAVGLEATPERVARIENAEEILRAEGFSDIRVRYHHGDLARIEVSAHEIDRFADEKLRQRIETQFRDLGFKYVCVDLAGFRSGSMNAVLPIGLLPDPSVTR